MKLYDIHLLILRILYQTTEVSFTKLYVYVKNNISYFNYQRDAFQQKLRRLIDNTNYIQRWYTSSRPRELIVRISPQGQEVLEKFARDFFTIPFPKLINKSFQ